MATKRICFVGGETCEVPTTRIRSERSRGSYYCCNATGAIRENTASRAHGHPGSHTRTHTASDTKNTTFRQVSLVPTISLLIREAWRKNRSLLPCSSASSRCSRFGLLLPGLYCLLLLPRLREKNADAASAARPLLASVLRTAPRRPQTSVYVNSNPVTTLRKSGGEYITLLGPAAYPEVRLSFSEPPLRTTCSTIYVTTTTR